MFLKCNIRSEKNDSIYKNPLREVGTLTLIFVLLFIDCSNPFMHWHRLAGAVLDPGTVYSRKSDFCLSFHKPFYSPQKEFAVLSFSLPVKTFSETGDELVCVSDSFWN